ncbi:MULTISPECIES: translation initiation factor IF-2 [Fischerella]|uniref:Translation initiation factor IF-2 n=1 Tax=Fischerella muscicola CCMEE 5323 TaxID=2019572 RepID=A0A2N6K5J4_FISMU|nr:MULTISPECIES: translation initiation factor IF-2 [Fischerella]MBD2434804.1 translation initiation factor IF-2 [Fischerella sp. FACHB-380]PLZ91774.1 translation initiation factor IF-2 [Fischerella muscicola CCMEE 5323]
MNNGKVRIYELSKELNLDNKELLAICDQLNIAVKSHSSTITESEAERIRSQAEKVAATHQMSKKEHHGAISHKPNTAQIPSRHRPAASQKQELLEIRKPKPPKNSPGNALEASAATNSQFASSEVNPLLPPRPFATPVSSMKPTAPIRPVSRNQSEAIQETAALDADKTPKSNQPKEKMAAEKPEPTSPAPNKPKPEKPQKPQLVAPPTRPAADKPESTPQPHQQERPILKRDRDQTRDQVKGKGKPQPATNVEAGQTTQQPPRPARPVPGQPKSEQKGNKGVPVAGDTPRPKPPTRPTPVPAAVGPQKPGAVSPVKSQIVDEVETETEEDTPEIIELKRPTPPRQPKTGKKWQPEEEIDEVKESGKAKVGAKGKRVKPIVDDEDFEEDFLDDEDAELAAAAVAVSNAIVRPPKPKSGKAAQPAAVVAAPKPTKKAPAAARDQQRRPQEQKRERPEKLIITGTMTVQELADALVVADTEIVKILFLKGMAVSITQSLDIPTITLIANELGTEVETQQPEAEARKVTEMIDVADLENLQRRPPVVTIMGHVDHGKTTLLDSIRNTKVAAGEAGGITQHIGAYHVDVEHDGKVQQVVFLDTPGHEAFTAMRARGARVTDIAILVVAADDGVRPQTIEAISHAKAAEVPIVVAINKIDKEGAQPDRVKQELTNYGLTPEEWGGETIMVPVSAIKGENLDTLLEMILLVAEVEELSANPDRPAKGTVIEAHLDKAKGAVATLLVQNGTLRVGDILVAGSVFGKVRAMIDDRARKVEAATPSFAVEVLGLSDVPAAGDEFEVFQNEKEARALANDRAEKQRQSRLMQGRVTLAAISAQAQEGELKELNLILKGDVQGSVEAIVGSLKQIPQNEVQIRLLLAAAGEITQTDIDLAAASGAVIIGFNTTYASGARQAADEAGVDVREYNIIYKLLEDIQGALEGLLEPELVEEPLGQAEVRAVFPVGRGAVAGCYVQSGKLVRNCKVRVRRGGKVVYEGILDSLKRMKEDAREVNTGFECGVGIDKYSDWTEGDIIEAYQMVTKRRTLSAAAR